MMECHINVLNTAQLEPFQRVYDMKLFRPIDLPACWMSGDHGIPSQAKPTQVLEH